MGRGGGRGQVTCVCQTLELRVSEETTVLYREEAGGPGAQVCLGTVPRGMRL